MTDADYVTLLPAVRYQRWCVTVMRHQGNEEYVQTRVSQPLKKEAAEALARSWAAASRLEIR